MDLTQHSRYRDLYKSRTARDLGDVNKKALKDKRSAQRTNVLMGKRKIDVPIAPKPETNPKQVLLEKLRVWKEQKKREKIEKKSREKPLFKVHHVSVPLGLPNLENVNKLVKGKPFHSRSRGIVTSGTHDFISEKIDYKFNTTTTKKSFVVFGKDEQIKKNKKDGRSPIVTRLRSRKILEVKQKKEGEHEKENIGIKKKKSISKKYGNPDSRSDTIYRTPAKKVRTQLIEDQIPNEVCKTPTGTKKNLANSYVSPFVTISRGSNSARKEYQARLSQGGLYDVSPEMAKATGPLAASAYFHEILDNEIARIEELCQTWLTYKDEEGPPEEAVDMIHTAVGQSKLLINKKFKKFRNLVLNCENGDGERPVTASDLHGYWEMAYLEVQNVDKRFENLDNMKKNNWEEVLPQQPLPKKMLTKKKIIKKPKEVKAQSSLKDMIKAQRKKIKQQDLVNVEQFFVAATPNKSSRRQSRISSKGRVSGSPGLFMIKVAQIGRALTDGSSSHESTPGRSILKTPRSKSVYKKSVLFNTESIDNNNRSLSSIETPTQQGPRRRSTRLSSRSKLDFIE